MKWLFFALLVVNVSLAAFQWVQHREQAVMPEFEENVNANKITLLSDLRAKSVSGSEEGRRCAVLGPFSNRAEIDVNIGKLNADESTVRIVEQLVDRAPAYWVYLSRPDAGEDAISTLRGVSIETYRIASGELTGGVSLGVFENMDLAKSLVKKVKKQGLNPQIFEKPRQVASYWLEYELDYAAENQQKINEITGFLPKDIKKREIFCKSVASEK